MKNFILSTALVLAFCLAASAQTNQTSPCPTIFIEGGGSIQPGENLTFKVKVENYQAKNLAYNWTVSAGKILRGQGTPTVSVSTEKWEDVNTTATAEIKGLPEGCENEVSLTASLIIDWVTTLLDEYGKFSLAEEKARLDKIDTEFLLKTYAQLYFVIYLTNKQELEEIKSRVLGIESYLSETRKIPKDNILFVFSEGDAYRTEIFLVPPGAKPPDIENRIELDLQRQDQTTKKTAQKPQKKNWKGAYEKYPAHLDFNICFLFRCFCSRKFGLPDDFGCGRRSCSRGGNDDIYGECNRN
jgi:hypothetical protein